MKLRFSLVTGALLTCSCVASTTTSQAPDAAHAPDAATLRRDAAVVVAEDASVPDAALEVPDAAVILDAGVPDSSVPLDASLPVDASMPDAFVPVDAGGDLGWPWDAAVPQGCMTLLDPGGGNAWTGWGNYQHPAVATVTAGEMTPLLFGQVYQQGVTEAAGQAPGFEAQLLVGPYGTLPTDGRCWSATPAAFNVNAGNNDEYQARISPASPGVFALYYRYRPADGAWLYADADGSTNLLAPDQAGLLQVNPPTTPGQLTLVTMNLRCRLDDWTVRKPLLVRALVRVNPDLMGFQEDCLDVRGASQADELRAELSVVTGRGYESRRVTTHTAMDGAESFEEGISVLSALPVESSRVLDLPSELFPRKAIVVEIRGLRFYNTHLEFGTQRAALRLTQVQAILQDAQNAAALTAVVGDFNATPDSTAVQAFGAGFVDVWALANPSQPGLTHPATTPTRRIDYVMVKTSVAGVLGARILDENDGVIYLSDHRGVAGRVAP